MTDHDDMGAVLRRLATVLGVPVSTFYNLDPSSAADQVLAPIVLDLIQAFTRVRDSAERQRCLDLLSSEARRLRKVSDDEGR